MRKLMVTAIALVILGSLTGPALAGKGGGSGSGALTGTIELDTSGARLADAAAWPKYGDKVGFRTTVEGRLGPKSMVYVTVVCLQGGNVVYQWSADPSFQFPLGDQAGQGLEWNGGDADCSGTLVYREESGRNITYLWLDQTMFQVAA